jgi:hypothetical protein
MLAKQPSFSTTTGKNLNQSIWPAVCILQFLPACLPACLGDAITWLVAIEDRDQVGNGAISHGVAGFMGSATDVG